MKKIGHIKVYRKELEYLSKLSDPEYRYYYTSRINAVWDSRNRWFGTFDARGKTIKGEWFPNWSTGKINMVKNKLLKKGYYKQVEDKRLYITNFDLLMFPSIKCEKFLQKSEENLLKIEKHIHNNEIKNKDYEKTLNNLLRDSSVFGNNSSVY